MLKTYFITAAIASALIGSCLPVIWANHPNEYGGVAGRQTKQLANEFDRLHKVKKGVYVGFAAINAGSSPSHFAFEFRVVDETVSVRVKSLSTSSDPSFSTVQTWVAQGFYDFELGGGPRRLEVPLGNSDAKSSIENRSLPYLLPWSKERELDENVLGRLMALLAKPHWSNYDGEKPKPTLSDLLSYMQKPERVDVAKLYGHSQEEFLSPPAKKSLSKVKSIFDSIILKSNGHYFTCHAMEGPSRMYARAARSPNEAFEWLEIESYGQSTQLKAIEYSGKAQFWVLEDELGQLDGANGIAGKGSVVMAVRGYSRTARVNVMCSENAKSISITPVSLKEDAEVYWSPWEQPKVAMMEYRYTIMTNGEVTFKYSMNPMGTEEVDPSTLGMKLKYLERLLEITAHKDVQLPVEELELFKAF